MSYLRVIDIGFPMIRRKVSPILIDLTPGHLSSAINLHATKASSPFGSTKAVQIFFAREAMTSHRSEECERNNVHKRLHPAASMQVGPAAPSILSTVSWMKGPSIRSKWTEWGSSMASLGSQIADRNSGWADGCFSSRMSRTV